MIFRFSLYGFLKNQKYYEPFLILAFLAKGLSFFQIGLLIACREITINLFEIPSGAVADLYGRRRSMVFSFCAFIASFIIFALSRAYWTLFVAMFLFGLGDAFRTGTHKAIILHWLELQGRFHEKTRVYGVTRSWAQVGSALSVVIAAALVFYTGDYTHIFWFCAIPYAVGIVNFLGYPKALDGPVRGDVSFGRTVRLVWQALRRTLRARRLRRLLIESLGFQGAYKVAKDYIQPALKSLALCLAGLPVLAAVSDDAKRVAVVVGAVYFFIHVLDAVASRLSHRVQSLVGHEDRAARALWGVAVAVFAGLALALWLDIALAAIVGFVLLAALQNVWRPIQVGRVAAAADSDKTATILSVESQSVCAFAAIMAPLAGWLVDALRAPARAAATSPAVFPLLPVALIGLAIAVVMVLLPRAEGPSDRASG